jgi:hypothetical protein
MSCPAGDRFVASAMAASGCFRLGDGDLGEGDAAVRARVGHGGGAGAQDRGEAGLLGGERHRLGGGLVDAVPSDYSIVGWWTAQLLVQLFSARLSGSSTSPVVLAAAFGPSFLMVRVQVPVFPASTVFGQARAADRTAPGAVLTVKGPAVAVPWLLVAVTE